MLIWLKSWENNYREGWKNKYKVVKMRNKICLIAENKTQKQNKTKHKKQAKIKKRKNKIKHRR